MLVELTKDELGIINNALNEVYNGIHLEGEFELGFENICERRAREHGVYVQPGEPNVIYLETIRGTSAAEGKFISQSGERERSRCCPDRAKPNERI